MDIIEIDLKLHFHNFPISRVSFLNEFRVERATEKCVSIEYFNKVFGIVFFFFCVCHFSQLSLVVILHLCRIYIVL